jgi:RimJ/RimL family protein N-acetyltransferase
MGLPNQTTIVLQTTRFYLRPVRQEDARLLFELDSDPEVMRFISKGEPTPMNKIEDVILPKMLGYYRHWPPLGFWAAHLLSHEEFIGWFHLRPDKIDTNEIELGYRLKRNAWGKGLATEGSRAIVEAAFGKWGYPKISARTLIINTPSRRVMEKSGLRFEKEFLWGAEVLPDWTEEERRGVKYSLTQRAWQAANESRP